MQEASAHGQAGRHVPLLTQEMAPAPRGDDASWRVACKVNPEARLLRVSFGIPP